MSARIVDSKYSLEQAENPPALNIQISPATPHLILQATVKIFFKHIAGLIYDHTARLLAISIILLTLSINSVLFVSGSQLILTELSMSSTGIPIASST